MREWAKELDYTIDNCVTNNDTAVVTVAFNCVDASPVMYAF